MFWFTTNEHCRSGQELKKKFYTGKLEVWSQLNAPFNTIYAAEDLPLLSISLVFFPTTTL